MLLKANKKITINQTETKHFPKIKHSVGRTSQMKHKEDLLFST